MFPERYGAGPVPVPLRLYVEIPGPERAVPGLSETLRFEKSLKINDFMFRAVVTEFVFTTKITFSAALVREILNWLKNQEISLKNS